MWCGMNLLDRAKQYLQLITCFNQQTRGLGPLFQNGAAIKRTLLEPFEDAENTIDANPRWAGEQR